MARKMRRGLGAWTLMMILALWRPSPVHAGIDIDLAAELGLLSLQAYQMLADFQNQLPFTLPAPYQLVTQILTAESLTGNAAVSQAVPIAFIATKDDVIYVVFRGTTTPEEFLLDAEIGQVPYTAVRFGGMTEQGFTRLYESINEQIVQTVKQIGQGSSFSKLYITGHSLGGALAVLAVPELAKKTRFWRPTMYSFAGPFVGNPRFAFLYRFSVGPSWRVVNTNDLVPKLPLPLTITQEGVFLYRAVPKEFPVTFGDPIDLRNFFADLEANHSLCTYYNTLCELTADPPGCMAQANGVGGCNTAP